MIASLEENRFGAETERQTAEVAAQGHGSTARLVMKQSVSASRSRSEKLMAKAQEEAREAIVKAKREAEQIIADLRQLAKEEGGASKEHKLIDARRKLDEAAPELHKTNEMTKSKAAKQTTIEAGDEVMVYSLNQKAQWWS